MYSSLIKPLLFRVSPERAHRLAMGGLHAVGCVPGGNGALSRLWGHGVVGASADPALSVQAMGLSFPNPVMLAAGFDKGAEAYNSLLSLGFGAVEVGTITGQAQAGNEKPRVFRLPADECLINRMGFNNCGAQEARKRLERSHQGVVGINIGKTKVVAEEDAIADYVFSAEALGALGDYVVVNVSSPNTPGLRSLQSVEKLRPLLEAVKQALVRTCAPAPCPPLAVKIAPDLADEDVCAIGDLAVELGLAAVIATNTTLSRANLQTPSRQVEAMGAGGLSGPVLEERALNVLKLLRTRTAGRISLIAAGGIHSSDAAWDRIVAGASLVQLYTSFVYQGPSLPGRVARGLLRRAREEGFATLQAAVDHYGGQINPSG